MLPPPHATTTTCCRQGLGGGGAPWAFVEQPRPHAPRSTAGCPDPGGSMWWSSQAVRVATPRATPRRPSDQAAAQQLGIELVTVGLDPCGLDYKGPRGRRGAPCGAVREAQVVHAYILEQLRLSQRLQCLVPAVEAHLRPMHSGLQPRVLQAATPRTRGCNPMCSRLQPGVVSSRQLRG